MIAIMMILFLALLFLGVPVAFALGLPAIVYFFLAGNVPIAFMAHSMTTPLFNYVLIALPAFLLSGRMMNSTGVTDRLHEFAVALVGRFRGGLIHANVFGSMIFASMSGTAVGDAGGLGQVEIQMMEKSGYRRDLAAGVTAASSVLGPIIPPSVAMIILGAAGEISIGRMFLGGIVPGLILAGCLMGYISLRAHFTEEGRSWRVEKVPFREVIRTTIRSLPPLGTPLIIVGGMTWGIVTPTEAAVLAIDYALILGIFYREITWKSLWNTLEETVVTTGVFMFIIAVAGFFTWIVTKEGLTQALNAMLAPVMNSSQLVGMFLIAIFLLVVGCFLDTTAAILMVTPILMPVVNALGIDRVYFGVIMTVALIIGVITPPFGICLFVVAEVAHVPVSAVTKEAIRYVPAMIVTLILIILFPQLILWVPNQFFK